MTFPFDPDNLTPPQKAAVFLIAMGEEHASRVFKKMTDKQLHAIATEMARIDSIPPKVLKSVTESFGKDFTRETAMMVRGDTFLKTVMERSLDREKAAAVAREVELRNREEAFGWSEGVDAAAFAKYIEGEHPQTAAMILAHLPPEIAAHVLSNLPEERKPDLALRVARLGQIPEEIIRTVDEILKRELGNFATMGGQAGGVQVLVDILGGVDKETEDTVMGLLEKEEIEMAGEIRSRMFVFEDLIGVDNKGMVEILKQVELPVLATALRNVGEEMREKVRACVSQRNAEMLMDELEAMGPVRLSEVTVAQQAIVNAAKELEARGVVALGGKGKDDILV